MDMLATCFLISLLPSWIFGQIPAPQPANFGLQLKCAGVTNPTRYLDYGCWCGPLNSGGRTLDNLDNCCMNHDHCFVDARRRHGVSAVGAFTTTYRFRCNNGTPICGRGSGLGRELCDCDNAMTLCVSNHNHEYRKRNIVNPFLRRRRCRPR